MRPHLTLRWRLVLYKLLTIVWFVLLIVAMWFLTDKQLRMALAAFSTAIATILVQACLIRCPHCHTRPALWMLAIWTLLLDWRMYIVDIILLANVLTVNGNFNRPSVARLIF